MKKSELRRALRLAEIELQLQHGHLRHLYEKYGKLLDKKEKGE